MKLFTIVTKNYLKDLEYEIKDAENAFKYANSEKNKYKRLFDEKKKIIDNLNAKLKNSEDQIRIANLKIKDYEEIILKANDDLKKKDDRLMQLSRSWGGKTAYLNKIKKENEIFKSNLEEKENTIKSLRQENANLEERINLQKAKIQEQSKKIPHSSEEYKLNGLPKNKRELKNLINSK